MEKERAEWNAISDLNMRYEYEVTDITDRVELTAIAIALSSDVIILVALNPFIVNLSSCSGDVMKIWR